MYMAFNESDDSTAMGVTLSYAGQTGSFRDNIYCSNYVDTGCHMGNNECRMSAAIINHKVMTQADGDGMRVATLMQRSIGYIFNQTLTESYWSKCAYLYDGADSYNVNLGCGSTATTPQECENRHAAYYNMCSSDGGTSYHHCTATDPEVANRMCRCDTCDTAYGTITPPRFKNDETCFYEMPALIVDHDDQSSFTPSNTNHLRDSIKQRVASDASTGQHQEWNEVVIDERLLLPMIEKDPTHSVVAFFYVDGASMWVEDAKRLATSMRDRFQEQYHVSGVPDIPVVLLDSRNVFTNSSGPFKLGTSESHVVV